jgi:two-component system nitrogen regulation response regulator GlnG
MRQLVLVVEDEPEILRVVCRYLEEAGFRCLTADSAARAMEVVSTGPPPDLMVIDVRLPDRPGPELALQVHHRYPRTPALFISGWVGRMDDPWSLAALKWEFLQKPFEGAALIGLARQLMGLMAHEAAAGSSHSTDPL